MMLILLYIFNLLSIDGKYFIPRHQFHLLSDTAGPNVLDYIELGVRKADGEEWILEIEKEYEEDLGIEFESSLMDEYRSCRNHCIFCFIDQMPKGMRETLYFKDDDSRLSFLQGNYVTLTNMSDHDIDRIIHSSRSLPRKVFVLSGKYLLQTGYSTSCTAIGGWWFEKRY